MYIVKRQFHALSGVGYVQLFSPEGHELHPAPMFSPTGFEYGYAGSGPHELSYIVLQDFYRRRWGVAPELPIQMVRDFVLEVVATMAHHVPHHEIHDSDIELWLLRHNWSLDACAMSCYVLHEDIDVVVYERLIHCVERHSDGNVRVYLAPNARALKDRAALETKWAEDKQFPRVYPISISLARAAGCACLTCLRQ